MFGERSAEAEQDEGRRLGQFCVTGELLQDLLRLPVGTKVVSIEREPASVASWMITIEDESFKPRCGECRIDLKTPRWRADHVIVFEGWD